MRNASPLLCCAILASLLSACGKSDTSVSEPTVAASDTVTAAKEPVASASTAVPAVTGVAACDSFLAEYEQCLTGKIPAEVLDPMKTGLEQWKKSWRDLANNAATKDRLPQICEQSRAATKPALQAYGCTL